VQLDFTSESENGDLAPGDAIAELIAGDRDHGNSGPAATGPAGRP
jgi:hypothetical protein